MSPYIHTVPGRLRIKHPSLKHNPRKCEMTRAALQYLHGVHEIKANPATGSVLIRYDGSMIEADRLLSILEERRLIRRGIITNRADGSMENLASETGSKMGKALIGWAVGKALEGSGLSLLAALI